AACRRHLQTNPKAALKEFDLSTAEMAAITSGDPGKLTALGIDQRMSRMFAIDAGAGGVGASARFDTAAASYAHTNARIDAETGGISGQELERVDTDPSGAAIGRVDDASGGSAGLGSHDDGAGSGRAGDLLERIESDPSSVLARVDDESGGMSGLGSHDDGAGSGAVDVHDVSGGLPQGGAETPNDL